MFEQTGVRIYWLIRAIVRDLDVLSGALVVTASCFVAGCDPVKDRGDCVRTPTTQFPSKLLKYKH